MRSFKEWLYNELAGKNAYKRMVMQHPGYQGMPALARKEFIDSSFGSTVNTSSAKAMKAKSNGQPVNPNSVMQPSQFLDNSPYKDRDWSQPVWIEVTPMNFNNETLDLLVARCFGYRPLPTIRDDEARTSTQKGMMNVLDMQPVILFREGPKFKLQEGWHRTMSRMLWEGDESLGAPSDQIELLKAYAQKLIALDQQYIPLTPEKMVHWKLATHPVALELQQQLNFANWKPVKIKAIIGTPLKDVQRPANKVDYMASTAMMPNPDYMASTAAFMTPPVA